MAKGKQDAAPSAQKLDDDQMKELFRRNREKYSSLLAKKKEADAALRNHGKIIKSDHGDHGLDLIKLSLKIIEGDSDALEAEKEKLNGTLRIMRWEGVPLGVQGELFTAFDERPIEERAFELGRADGIAGKAMKPPIELVGNQGPAFEEYCRGWHLGQDKIFDIRKTDSGKSKGKDEGQSPSIN